jgi:Rieske Fe-S protein
MCPDVRDVLRRGAGEPSRPVPVGDVLARSRRLARRQRLAAAAAAAVLPFAVVAAVRLGDGSRTDSLVASPGPSGGPSATAGEPSPTPSGVPGAGPLRRVPGEFGEVAVPQGDVGYDRLADGRRVYVVAHADGTVSVLDAVSTHRPFGLGKQVGWCPGARSLDDAPHGSRYDEYGVYLYGPAPTDLVRYETAPARPGRLRVTARLEPTGRGESTVDVEGPACIGTGVTDDSFVLWDLRGNAEVATVADLPAGRWASVTAVLSVDRDGTARLCDGFSGGGRCGSGIPVTGIDRALADVGKPGSAYVLASRFVVLRGDDGAEVVRVERDEVPGKVRDVWFVRGASEAGGRRAAGADKAEWLTGDAATQAAADAGSEVPVPNDYYVRNENPLLRDLVVTDRTVFAILVDGVRPEEVSWERFVEHQESTAYDPLVSITFAPDGTVERLAEEFRP